MSTHVARRCRVSAVGSPPLGRLGRALQAVGASLLALTLLLLAGPELFVLSLLLEYMAL